MDCPKLVVAFPFWQAVLWFELLQSLIALTKRRTAAGLQSGKPMNNHHRALLLNFLMHVLNSCSQRRQYPSNQARQCCSERSRAAAPAFVGPAPPNFCDVDAAEVGPTAGDGRKRSQSELSSAAELHISTALARLLIKMAFEDDPVENGNLAKRGAGGAAAVDADQADAGTGASDGLLSVEWAGQHRLLLQRASMLEYFPQVRPDVCPRNCLAPSRGAFVWARDWS